MQEPAAVSHRHNNRSFSAQDCHVLMWGSDLYLADSEGEDNNLEEEGDDWMSDELSGSDGENVEDVPKW